MNKKLKRQLRGAAARSENGALVFAYGSNMNAEQMMRRCPRAVYQGPAGVPKMRLGFTGYSDRWQGAVATLEAHPNSFAVGRLWLVDQGDLQRLDKFEGSPAVYLRREVLVLLPDGTELMAETYVHRHTENGPWVMPSAAYINTISRGFEDTGFDVKILRSAVGRCRQLVAARDEYEEES